MTNKQKLEHIDLHVGKYGAWLELKTKSGKSFCFQQIQEFKPESHWRKYVVEWSNEIQQYAAKSNSEKAFDAATTEKDAEIERLRAAMKDAAEKYIAGKDAFVREEINPRDAHIKELEEKLYKAQEACNEVAAYGDCTCDKAVDPEDCCFCQCVETAKGFTPRETKSLEAK